MIPLFSRPELFYVTFESSYKSLNGSLYYIHHIRTLTLTIPGALTKIASSNDEIATNNMQYQADMGILIKFFLKAAFTTCIALQGQKHVYTGRMPFHS